MRHLFHCLVIHALIMVGMFGSPTFRDLVVNQIVQADPDSRNYLAKATGYRIAGLTDSWDALSGLQSLGLLMLPILLTRQTAIVLWIRTVGHSLTLVLDRHFGTDGLRDAWPICCRWPCATPTSARSIVRPWWVARWPSSVRHWSWDHYGTRVSERWKTRHWAEPSPCSVWTTVEHHQHGEQLGDTFAGILAEHYFLPETWRTLLWGTGGSGRETWDYVPADNGLVLNLHNLGIGCFSDHLWFVALDDDQRHAALAATHPEVAGVTCAGRRLDHVDRHQGDVRVLSQWLQRDDAARS